MALEKEEIRDLYRKRARGYDISANLYYLIGFREAKYRKMAVSQLALRPGNSLVEIGCGTGLNFRYALNDLGPMGKLIGVDLTDAMLKQAEARVNASDWRNITLIQSDAAKYIFPSNIDGVFSSFALTLVPEYQTVIKRASHALREGGRLVILDFKKPETWPLWITKLGVAITKPFGVSLDLADRKPWETMKRYFRHVTITNMYGGFVYIATGEK